MYVTELFKEELLAEVAMSPSAIIQSFDTGVKEGVKVGFEFEVCVPKEVIRNSLNSENIKNEIISQIPNDWWTKLAFYALSGRYRFQEIFPGLDRPVIYRGKKYTKLTPLIDAYQNNLRMHLIRNLLSDDNDLLSSEIKAEIKNKCYSRAGIIFYHNIKNYIRELSLEYDQDKMITQAILDSEFYNFTRKINNVGLFCRSVFGSTKSKTVLPYLKIIISKLSAQYYIRDPAGITRNGRVRRNNYNGASFVMKAALQQIFGVDVKVFQRYHEEQKSIDSWYIEPDSSVHPGIPNPSEPNIPHKTKPNGDGACEIITPPLPVEDALDVLEKFYDLAEELNLYTGKSYGTGLHINVSIPKSLDLLKLAVFLGDEYVLSKFGRLNSRYASSVIRYLRGRANPYPKDSKNFIDELTRMANHATNDHMASISNENGSYVSFRHVGGDYLNDHESVLLVFGRFIRAMVIASDPNLYRQEYLKKITKYFQDSTNIDTSSLTNINQFSQSPIKALVAVLCPTSSKGNRNNLIRTFKSKYSWIIGTNPVLTLSTQANLPLVTQFINDFSKANTNRNDYATSMKQDLYDRLTANANRAIIFAIVGIDPYYYHSRKIGVIEPLQISWGNRVGFAMIRGIELQPGSSLHTQALDALRVLTKQNAKERKTSQDDLKI